MKLATILDRIATRLVLRNDSLFCCSLKTQKQYIEHFVDPKDDFQRSYFQYMCQIKLNKFIVNVALNVVMFPLLVFYLCKRGSVQSDNVSNAVFFSDGKPANIIPDELKKKVENVVVVNDKKEFLTKEGRNFIYSIWKKHPFSIHFIVKILLKIRYYDYEIIRHNPKYIIVCNEYSFTSSVLTKYCEERGIKHINVMHGEKLYYMRDSFFHFHECYVWDEYYKNLFVKLRAETTQFKIAVPPSLKFPEDDFVPKTVDYTYYLGAERGLKLRTIINALECMRLRGLNVAIRPHPRYTDLNEITRVAPKIEIEDCKKMTIEQSLKRTVYAVSLYSTVLNQAYNNGIGIVLDDISDKDRFNLLNELLYVMLNKPHKLLSQLLEASV